ncbi:MAG: ATP synthase F1 subunit gamma [Blautia sp.]|nr:ATP synthase F1 subunit gamma [Blautia sp.]
MAAANMKAVKLRIKSVQNTMQITKAMQLVAASKLRKAKDKAMASKPYLRTMKGTLTKIANENTDFQSIFTTPGASEKRLFVVIAGDRGLAGGYNANLFKFVENAVEGHDYAVLPIGKKAVEYFRHRGVEIFTDAYEEVAKVTISDCFRIAKSVCEAYEEGQFGHVSMCYTNFISMMSQVPKASALLPLSDFENPDLDDVPETKNMILYEPNGEEVFNTIVPDYLAGILYTSINVSVASELAARRTAMEAATDNAGEMIEKLSLFYNRARQASITQEITEIVAGAEGS